MDNDTDEDANPDIRAVIFHNTIRQQIIFLILFILLCLGSSMLIGRFRRRDRADFFSSGDDEMLVYRISLWMCTFSLAVAIGTALLLPISIVSNEVRLLYPDSFYVKWLNSSLIQSLWNHVFLCSNLSLFVLLPFSYLFSESSGFSGHKKGVIARAYETFTVFSLLAFAVMGIIYVLSAVIYPEKSGLRTLLDFGSYYLPFLYSCVSFMGVILLLVCTPLGFVRLFGVVGQVLVKPNLLRDINEEYTVHHLEEAAIVRKLANLTNGNYSMESNGTPRLRRLFKFNDCNDTEKYCERLKEIEADKRDLDKLKSSSAFQRNFVYPFGMLLILFFTGITVLLVVQNTLELLIGIKALPLSTRQFTLGITSLSMLGPIGAALEVCIIFYLGAASSVGLYTMPFMKSLRPHRRQTSLPQLILNAALILILSSALPLLSRILGITNFNLLGEFGSIQWLGNFQIVFLYNLIFGTATALCIVNKFTATVRRELCARLVENYVMFTNYISFIN